MLRPLALLALITAVGACSPAPPPPVPPPVVRTRPAGPLSFSDSVETVSTLEADGEVRLATQGDGRIEALLVRQGDPVRAGQLLMVLDQARVRADVARLRAEMETALLTFRRFDWLARQGASSALERDQVRQEYISAREALRGRQADLSLRELRAPIAGVVGDLRVKLGDVVEAGSPFAAIVRNDRLLARIDVPAALAAELRLGQPVTLLDPLSGRPLAQGQLGSIDPAVAPASQALLVKARIANPRGQLRAGMRVRARLELGRRSQLAVPFAAVSRRSGQSFVSVLGPPRAGGTRLVQQRPVRLGPLQNDHYPVLGGLAPGEAVIVSRVVGLRPGQPVRTRDGG
ncbi:MAG: efflux RND transporter periplasmic adaptor subunit [Cyanobacteriota bacterium]|jgi:RND family efflux transporter MFP subunit|nr:efflux RND transporter periplasmic adaptor subunit [Cyanobacteriota bacterium]